MDSHDLVENSVEPVAALPVQSSQDAPRAFLDPKERITEDEWLTRVYQGDHQPQLTVRAVLLGGTLGALMSISNLYTAIKVGWLFGVAITACVLSFVIWNGLRLINPKLSEMSLLESNCMQSTASAAGYSTGATVSTAFGALLLITGHHVAWPILLVWTILTAALGVFLAVPLKRQMINQEQLPFPGGIAAAETLRSLYSRSKEAVDQAKALVCALAVGALVGFGKGHLDWQIKLGLKIPDLFPFRARVAGVDVSQFPNFGFEPSALMIGAGMIVGLRVSASMLVGSLLLYLVFGPQVINWGEVTEPAKILRSWSLWPGTAMLVTSGLTAFALQSKSLFRKKSHLSTSNNDLSLDLEARRRDIEVPLKWLVVGMVPLVLTMVFLEQVAFSISLPLGLLSVVMSFFLALVACRATGETDITPIGAMGKISQLTYSVLAPSNMTTNLMAGSVTANIAAAASDLLTDLKSGYLLGANPRRQFIAQFLGIFFGTAAIIPAWYLMIPNKEVLESYNPPNVNMWRAVAEALAHGISYVPALARVGILVGGTLGIILVLIEFYSPPKVKRFLPSAMGLGMSWVFPFGNAFAFFVGALIAFLWSKISKRTADLYTIPVASGAIAGESLICAFLAMFEAFKAVAK